MFTWLLKLVSSGFLKKIVGVLTGTDDNSTQVAIAEIEAEIVSRRAARDIRLATAGFWEMRLITFVIAACMASHLAAVTLDTLWTSVNLAIPALPHPMNEWEGLILLSFFGVQLAQKGLSTLAAIFLRKRS